MRSTCIYFADRTIGCPLPAARLIGFRCRVSCVRPAAALIWNFMKSGINVIKLASITRGSGFQHPRWHLNTETLKSNISLKKIKSYTMSYYLGIILIINRSTGSTGQLQPMQTLQFKPSTVKSEPAWYGGTLKSPLTETDRNAFVFLVTT